jgi:hypothetical protein
MGIHENQSKMYPVAPASFILLLKRIGSNPSFWLLIHAIYALRVRRRRNRSNRFKAAKQLTRDRQQAAAANNFTPLVCLIICPLVWLTGVLGRACLRRVHSGVF